MFNKEIRRIVLAFVESHRRVTIQALVKSFPHFSPMQVLRAIVSLKNDGWIKLNDYYVEDGYSIRRRTAYRTTKELYEHIQFNF